LEYNISNDSTLAMTPTPSQSRIDIVEETKNDENET
jgi:hypothetical protein